MASVKEKLCGFPSGFTWLVDTNALEVLATSRREQLA
jgi:hypothetical protein